jgi:hypothetical protein
MSKVVPVKHEPFRLTLRDAILKLPLRQKIPLTVPFARRQGRGWM